MEKPHLVAVYGSLLSGLGNHGVMTEKGPEHYELLGTTKTEPKFTLFPLGGFPGIHENGETAITVEVYKVSDDLLKNSLDRLEGYLEDTPEQSFYIRKLIPTQFGETYIYIYNRDINRYPIIEDGDWRNYIQNR